MSTEPRFDADRNVMELGDRRLVFHCHHYNVSLQRSIEDMFGEGAIEMQIAAAAESTRYVLEGCLASDGTFEERLRAAAFVFGDNGFGGADVSELGAQGGLVTLSTSHYATGWRAKWGASGRPVCHFATGYWVGALAVAASLPPERVHGREERCAAVEPGACRIRLEVR